MLRVVQSALDLVYPPRCLECGAAGAVLCAACQARISLYAPPWCSRCGRPLPGDGASRERLCPVCLAVGDAGPLDALRVAAAYDGAVRHAVLALKYRAQRRVAEPLGELLARAVRVWGVTPDVVTSVPLHSQRRRQRGFNQSDLLARACARHLRVPYRALLLTRTRATPPQVGLSAAQRRVNVAGAFGLTGRAERYVAGRRILLVDDVTTTGSTLDAAATALRDAHPATIWGVAISRPELQEDHHDGRYWRGIGG